MRNIRSYTLTLITLAGFVALAGCGKDNDYAPAAIKVDVTGVETKALTTTDGMKGDSNGFVLDAWVDGDYKDYINAPSTTQTERHYINKTKVSWDGDSWEMDSDYKWISGLTTSFWAWYPASTNGTMNIQNPTSTDSDEITDQISFEYTTASTAAESDDIVFAHASKEHQSTGATDEDTISLEFHHAMAQVRFAVPDDENEFDTSLEIKSIELRGLNNNGICTYKKDNTFEWSSLNGSASMSQDYDASFDPVDDDWIDDGNGNFVASTAFYVIPQSTSGITVRITFAKDDEEAYADFDLDANKPDSGKYYSFKAGKHHTFLIHAQASILPKTVFDSVELTELYAEHESYVDMGTQLF